MEWPAGLLQFEQKKESRVDKVKSKSAKSYDWLEDALISVCRKVFPSESSMNLRSLVPRLNRIFPHQDYDFYLETPDTELRMILRLYHGLFSIWGGTENLKTSKEYSVLRHVYQNGYSVPFPYNFSSSREPFGWPFLIMDPGDGIRWWEIGESLRLLQEQLVNSLAEKLATLHLTIPAKHPLIPFVNTTYTMKQLESRIQKLENKELNRCFKHAKQQLKRQENYPDVFLHGCFSLDNVLIQNENVRTVINWEHTAIGDLRWDVAYTSLSLQRENDRSIANHFLAQYVQLIEEPLEDMGFWEGLVALRSFAQSQWLRSLDEKSFEAIVGLQTDLIDLEDYHRTRALEQFG